MTVARIAVAILIVAAGAWPAARALLIRQTTMDVVASVVSEQGQSGDVVLVSPWYFGVSFTRYYHGPLEVWTIPPISDMSLHRYDLVKQASSIADPLRPLRDRLIQVLTSGHRVLLVGTLDSHDGPDVQRWTSEIGSLIDQHAATRETVRRKEFAQPLESPVVTVIRGKPRG